LVARNICNASSRLALRCRGGQQRELPVDVVGRRRSCARCGVGEVADPVLPSDHEPGTRVSVGFGPRLKDPDDVHPFNSCIIGLHVA
jgi:hypothetical protein